MKRLFLTAGAIVIALASCQKKEEFKLQATGLPTDLEGKYAYIFQGASTAENVKDSVQVKDGAFAYTSAIDKAALYTIVVGQQALHFVKEAGVQTIAKAKDADKYTISGGPLNTVLNKYEDEVQKLAEGLNSKLQALQADSTKTQEDKVKEYESILNNYLESQKALAKSTVTPELKGTAVEVAAFEVLVSGSSDDTSDFIAAYEAASDAVKNHPDYLNTYNKLKQAELTGVGKKYVDFDFVPANGETVKFSSLVGDGKYLLVDFWASWCGPCRRALPHLADLNKKYAAKGLRLVSIAVWDKIEDNAKAVEELKIDWENYIDTKSEAANVYGIQGVPTIMLFSPEGDILVRTHNPEEINTKLAEIFK